MRTIFRTSLVAAAVSILAACTGLEGYEQPKRTDSLRKLDQVQRLDPRMRFSLDRIEGGFAALVPFEGDSTVFVHVDSLARTSRPGVVVRRCLRGPYAGGRLVTWCRDHAATDSVAAAVRELAQQLQGRADSVGATLAP
jgi:hypothetical protein